MSEVERAARALLERTELLRVALCADDLEALRSAFAAHEPAFARLAEALAAGVPPEGAPVVARAAEAVDALLAEARLALARAAEEIGALAEGRRAVEGFRGPTPLARFVSFRA